MKIPKIILAVFFILSSKLIFGQTIDPFLDSYKFYERVHSGKANEYEGIEGSPYLTDDFVTGTFHMKDSAVVKLPIRYNIYADEMQYQSKGINYAVGKPELLQKVILGESVFVFLPFIAKGGYFELVESGKCILVQKWLVKFSPAEGPKPIEGISKPAKFTKESDVFYLVTNSTEVFKVGNLKSVINALQNQKEKVERFIDQEKIKNTKKENLVKIVKYYNSL